MSHALELRLDVDAAYRAVLARHQPLVHAIAVEQMHAWQAAIKRNVNNEPSGESVELFIDSPNVVINLELRKADGALLAVLIGFTGTAQLFVLVRQRVGFDCFLQASKINF